MRVAIDQDRCIGAGQCVLAAPDVFDQGEDDGLVQLLDATPPADRREAVDLAARECPAAVIAVHEG